MSGSVSDFQDVLARYKRMRGISLELNKVLPKFVPKEAVEAMASQLGFWQDGTLVFDNLDQSCVLFDHAIHGWLKDGRNAVDRYVAEHPPTPGSDDYSFLNALQRTFFSLFQVEGIVDGVGVHVLDILHDRRHFLADVGLSQTAVEGLVLASRVTPFEDFIMTTGAPLPADADVLAGTVCHLEDLGESPQDMANMTRQEQSDLAAKVISLCLESEEAPRIRYGETDDDSDARVIPVPRSNHIGRNDPCPCGSGKKYKKCCGQ